MDLCVEDVLGYWWALVRPFFGSLPILFWRWSRGVSLFYAGGCNSLFWFMWGDTFYFYMGRRNTLLSGWGRGWCVL